jgi:hypothetical protein
MAAFVHPRIQTREAREDRAVSPGTLIRVLVYAPVEALASWVHTELDHPSVMVQIGYSVGQVVSALSEDPPPRPQILVADFDDIGGAELLHLHSLREQGWFGRIIALGSLPPSLRTSLSIEHVLRAPLVAGALREVVHNTGFLNTTSKMPSL